MEGHVVAALPVALLEATRSHDRPGEVLEDEDLSVSLPRRFGLSEVVETQIQRYEARKRIPVEEFVPLLKLVLRRPDAEAILRETGARVAARHFEKVPAGIVSIVRILPRALGFVFVARSARKLLRNTTGSTHVDVHAKPLVARVHQPQTALLEPPGVACALYGSAFEELAKLYVGKKAAVAHTKCVINGGSVCEWSVDV